MQAGIGVGYLDDPALKPGAKLELELHGRRVPAETVKMPFYVSEDLKNVKA